VKSTRKLKISAKYFVPKSNIGQSTSTQITEEALSQIDDSSEFDEISSDIKKTVEDLSAQEDK